MMSTADVSRDDAATSRAADAELLQAVLEGDATAYRGLVEKYQGRVYAMVYGMIRNREDARDITQEALVKAYKKLRPKGHQHVMSAMPRVGTLIEKYADSEDG